MAALTNYITITSRIQVTDNQTCFVCSEFISRPISLLTFNTVCIFFTVFHIFALQQYQYVINTDQTLRCSIQRQYFLIFLAFLMSCEETVMKHHLVSDHSEQKKQHRGSYLCGLHHRFIYTYLIQRKQLDVTVSCACHKDVYWSGGSASLSLKLGTRWRWLARRPCLFTAGG